MVIIGIIAVFMITCLLKTCGIIKSKLLCKYMSWYCPNGTYTQNEINTYSTCILSNKKIIRDSQGNWF